ncbi:MAG: polysaccharide biosynthesis/export family protein [Flavobacteriales bacterium]
MFSFILVISCSSNKILFKDIPENISIKVPEAVITYGDLIDVKISSLTNQSTSIFSPIAMDKIGTIRDAEARKLDAYLVDSSGNIDIPYIGKIKAYGLTCTSLSDSIKNKLLEFVKTPSVSTKILNFRVSILGQVASPGTFDVIDQNMSFTELISRAGDFSKNADPSNVMIIRNINNKITTAYIDLTSFEFFNSEYYFLKQNDKVYVRPDNASLAFDFGFLRNAGALSLLTSIIILISR